MNCNRTFGLLVLVLVCCAVGSNAQDPMTAVANSHIEGNVPKGKAFDEYLTRDLTSYFCKGEKECRIEYELLRNGPTQSGTSYPKYYLWTRCWVKEKLMTEGAVRVAAIDQNGFYVTNFVSGTDILAAPEQVGQVFPSALVGKIVSKAQHR
jgi:hypothetical protein